MLVVEVSAIADVDVAAIKEYLNGQYADGWGEGYEQRAHKLYGRIDYYVHTWRARDFEIKLINP